MITKLLIPLSYLSEACFLSENIGEKKFKMSLKLSQEDLKDVLGPEFYEEIETQYSPNSDTLSADNEALYESYIKDYLAWRTYFHHLRFSQSDSTPTGQREFTEEHSTILADVKLAALEKNVNEQGERYKYQMITYMRNEQDKDSTKFPLWTDECKDEFSFGISSVSKEDDEAISINRAIKSNE